MATFPSITPQYGVQKRSAPNKRVVRFADGYEHRILFGLDAHTNPKVYSLKFAVSETDADTIETFLDARALDQDSFDFKLFRNQNFSLTHMIGRTYQPLIFHLLH